MGRKIPSFVELARKYPIFDAPDKRNLEDFLCGLEPVFSDFFRRFGIGPISEEIKTSLGLMLFNALRSADDRLALSRLYRSFYLELTRAYIRRIEVILEDEEFVRYMNFDNDMISERLKKSRAYEEHLKNTRSGQAQGIKVYLPEILIELKKQGLGQSQRLNFLHQLFVHVGLKEFGGSYVEAEKDRIRKWEEEVLQHYDTQN